MPISKLFNKAFVGGFWMVGLKDKSSVYYNLVKPENGQWLADPFLYEYKGKHYLFVEHYFNRKNRAAISVYEIENGAAINNKVIIDNPYHMSYPNVFYYKGEHWMIPESSSNQTLDLYHAKAFPFEWEHVTSILKDRRVVDTTVFINGDNVFLLSYENISNGWELHTFLFSMDDFSLSTIGETHYTENVGRPAGRLFEKDGRLFRPAQNCKYKYGESLLIYEITALDASSYHEELIDEIKIEDIKMSERFERVHTLNSDSKYEVVDVYQEHFDPLRWWKIFKRQYLKM